MMYNGDTAIGRHRSTRICRAGFRSSATAEVDGVRPDDDQRRPRRGHSTARAAAKLVLYGESLGSMAGQGAFVAARHRRMGFSRCSGWGRPTRARCGRRPVRRDPGTPEVEPRYDNGRTVRFSQATDAADDRRGSPRRRGRAPACCSCSIRPTRSSGGRRICCSPGRTGSSSRRADRTASMRWYPSSRSGRSRRHDQRRAVPGGHGHNYGDSCSTAGRPWPRPRAGRLPTPSASGSPARDRGGRRA